MRHLISREILFCLWPLPPGTLQRRQPRGGHIGQQSRPGPPDMLVPLLRCQPCPPLSLTLILTFWLGQEAERTASSASWGHRSQTSMKRDVTFCPHPTTTLTLACTGSCQRTTWGKNAKIMARKQLFWTVAIPLLQSHEPDNPLLPDGVLLQCMHPGGEDGHIALSGSLPTLASISYEDCGLDQIKWYWMTSKANNCQENKGLSQLYPVYMHILSPFLLPDDRRGGQFKRRRVGLLMECLPGISDNYYPNTIPAMQKPLSWKLHISSYQLQAYMPLFWVVQSMA